MQIVCIVEGHGDVSAIPLLIRRLVKRLGVATSIDIPHPIRIPKSRLLKPGELERAVELAGNKTSDEDGILILLYADRHCPANLAKNLLSRATRSRSDRQIRAVIAKSEYEAWFLAAASSIAGHRGLSKGLVSPHDPENIRDAKGWLSEHMSDRFYRETIDQPALTAIFDLAAARTTPSFDKFCRDIQWLVHRGTRSTDAV